MNHGFSLPSSKHPHTPSLNLMREKVRHNETCTKTWQSFKSELSGRQCSCLTLKVCGLTLLAGILSFAESYIISPIDERWNEEGSRHYIQDAVSHPSPSSRLLLSFPKTVYRKHKSNAGWAHYGQPSHNILPSPAPQPGPSSVVLATQHPRPWREGLVVCWLWCVGAGGAWCHLLWHGGGQSNPEKIMSPFVEPVHSGL